MLLSIVECRAIQQLVANNVSSSQIGTSATAVFGQVRGGQYQRYAASVEANSAEGEIPGSRNEAATTMLQNNAIESLKSLLLAIIPV